jgi:DNA (cytosine-5)-methyltransferase 1
VRVTRPRLLDLFCGAGGAATGYHRAGFDITGVDNRPQPRYPFEFIQADALTYPLGGYDAIHASPVCLTFARVTAWRGNRDSHPDTLTPTLARLARVAVPWVVENVEEAGLRADFLLCGSQFGLPVRRHRHFQAGNWSAYDLMPPCDHRGLRPFAHKDERAYADAMGCDWMTKTDARQAIPPAYTEYIGRLLMDHLTQAAA